MRLKITENGIGAILHCMSQTGAEEQSSGIIFTRIELGNGGDAGDEAEELSNKIMEAGITECIRDYDNDYVQLKSSYNNATIQSSFSCTETGVYIKDPENPDKEILFAYGYQDEESAYIIPAVSEYTFETIDTYLVYVGKLADVSAVISESLDYISRSEYRMHKDDKSNPHEVTKEQIGLGNVLNLTIDEQVPQIEEADTLSKLQVGDTMKTIIRKIAKAISSFITHLSAKNPHGITPETIGAAQKKHTHSTTDLTEGIMSIVRGGTGVNSKEGFVLEYGEALHIPYFGRYTGNGSESREIQTGFKPSAVFIIQQDGIITDDDMIHKTRGGLALRGYPAKDGKGHNAIEITENGFSINNFKLGSVSKTNEDGKSYHYIAWR